MGVGESLEYIVYRNCRYEHIYIIHHLANIPRYNLDKNLYWLKRFWFEKSVIKLNSEIKMRFTGFPQNAYFTPIFSIFSIIWNIFFYQVVPSGVYHDYIDKKDARVTQPDW